jgi:uroporphyrinogen-III synthase
MRVVVTRPEPQNRGLADKLRERGAEPILVPVLEIAELELSDRTREALSGFVDHDWVLFTSPNAVDVFARRLHDFYDPVLRKSGEADRIPTLFAELAARTKIGAVGDATAAALARYSVAVDLVPDATSGAALAAALGAAPAPGSILLPRSGAADEDVVEILKANGWAPRPVALYGPRAVERPPPTVAAVHRGEYDALTFASGSAVRAFVDIVGSPRELGLSIHEDPNKLVLCIGPRTGRAARDAGFYVSAVAESPSDAGLVEAIVTLQR